jgi:hypothetical protein
VTLGAAARPETETGVPAAEHRPYAGLRTRRRLVAQNQRVSRVAMIGTIRACSGAGQEGDPMIAKKFLWVLASGWLAAPTALRAHHSPAMFDGSRQLSLTGTVREFQWTNPHSYIQLVVKGDDGAEQEWSLEMGANVYLYNLGWRPSTVKPGDTLAVTVIPLRNGKPGGLLVEARTADGKALGANP